MGTRVSVVAAIANASGANLFYPDQGERTLATLSELRTVGDHWSFVDFGNTSFPLQSQILEKTSEFAPLQKVWRGGRGSRRRAFRPAFLHLSTVVEYSESRILAMCEPEKTPSNEEILQHGRLLVEGCANSLTGTLNEIILAANIARLDSLRVFQTYEFVEDLCVGKSQKLYADFCEPLGDARKRGWPVLIESSLPTVLNWLCGVPAFRERRTASRLGRALAAAAYLCNDDQSGDLAIVWALLGLESLYCRGNGDLQRQLSEKTAVYLGARERHKKDFMEMYNFRSRLLHGDRDLVFPYNDYDASEEFEDFHGVRFNHECTAIGLLFATLQKMCAEGRYELEFEYALKDGVRNDAADGTREIAPPT